MDSGELGETLLQAQQLRRGDEKQIDTATSTTPQSGTPRGGNGKIGQRITESELLRRRRLLDAHIFEGQG